MTKMKPTRQIPASEGRIRQVSKLLETIEAEGARQLIAEGDRRALLEVLSSMRSTHKVRKHRQLQCRS